MSTERRVGKTPLILGKTFVAGQRVAPSPTPTVAAEELMREWKSLGFGEFLINFQRVGNLMADALASQAREIEGLKAEAVEREKFMTDAIEEGIREAKDDADNFDGECWKLLRQLLQTRPGFSWSDYDGEITAQDAFEFLSEDYREIDKCWDRIKTAEAEVERLTGDRDHWHRAYQGYRRDFEAIYKQLGVLDTDDVESGKRLVARLLQLVDAEAERDTARAALEPMKAVVDAAKALAEEARWLPVRDCAGDPTLSIGTGNLLRDALDRLAALQPTPGDVT